MNLALYTQSSVAPAWLNNYTIYNAVPVINQNKPPQESVDNKSRPCEIKQGNRVPCHF